ncbi:MAG: SIMPL domain-containing protein [Thermonemataceae bacterium]
MHKSYIKHISLSLLLSLTVIYSKAQSKNFIDQPYLETTTEVDTLVRPDRIYLTIILDEADNRNKKSTETLESTLEKVLTSLGIDIEESLSLLDFSSGFKKYFLSNQKVLKTKMYSLVVKDAITAGKVLAALEEEGISNVSIEKVEYSKQEMLVVALKARAVLKAKQKATQMVAPLNQKIGKAIFISDSYTLNKQLQVQTAGIAIRGNSSLYGARSSEPLMIEFDKLKFSAKVNIKFVLE